jgi:4-amino-4-deoxy-L-arabinose transferase-like glycosyltransferase
MMPRRPISPLLVLTLLLLVAAAQRAWVAWSILDPTPDSGSVGLMALHITEGERPLFLYGFNYSGALLPYVMAGVFSLLGVSYFNFVATAVLFTLALVYVTYLLFSELFGRTAGLAAAACIALPDLVTAWYTTAPDCSYTPMFLLAAATLWLACRIARRPLSPAARWVHVPALGVTAGLSVWTHMICVVSLLCAAAILLPRLARERFRGLAPFLAGAVPFALGFVPYLFTDGDAGSVSTRWSAYPAVLRYKLKALVNDSLPHFYAWPHPMPRAAGTVAGFLVLALAAFYLAALRRRKEGRGLALLPLGFAGLFFAFYLPHDLATEAAPRYLVQVWLMLIGGMFAVACSAPRVRVRRAAAALLAGWLGYNALGVAAYGIHHQARTQAKLADYRLIVEGARTTGARHMVLLDDYTLAARGQTLSFLARDDIRFVAMDEERYQAAAQSADDDAAAAFAGRPAVFAEFTNALRRLDAAYETRQAGSLQVAYALRLPVPRGRAIPPGEMKISCETALSGEPANLLDREKDTMLMGPCDGQSRLAIDLGRARRVSGLALSPVGRGASGLPGSYRLEGSLDGTAYSLLQEVRDAMRLVYGLGGRVYAGSNYGWSEARFAPVETRFLRLTPLAVAKPSDTWFLSELLVFEEDPAGNAGDRESTAAALRGRGIRFTHADRWLSAALMRGVTRHYDEPPAYPRYNEHLRMVGSTVPMGVRRFQPRTGEAVAVEDGLAEETAHILRRAYGPGLTWRRDAAGGYTAFQFEEVPLSDRWLWWNGFMPLTMW